MIIFAKLVKKIQNYRRKRNRQLKRSQIPASILIRKKIPMKQKSEIWRLSKAKMLLSIDQNSSLSIEHKGTRSFFKPKESSLGPRKEQIV